MGRLVASSERAGVTSYHDAERRAFPVTAIADGRRLFVVFPDPGVGQVEPLALHAGGQVVMKLISLTLDDVINLERQPK